MLVKRVIALTIEFFKVTLITILQMSYFARKYLKIKNVTELFFIL